jgi:hypothetical protein
MTRNGAWRGTVWERQWNARTAINTRKSAWRSSFREFDQGI